MKHKLLIICIVCIVLAGCAGGVGDDLGHSYNLDSEDHNDGGHDDGDEEAHHADDGEEEEEVGSNGPYMCCKALIPSCIACSEGLTKQEWLDKTCGPNCVNAVYEGWDEDTNQAKWDCIF
jgi:hypothetical protein